MKVTGSGRGKHFLRNTSVAMKNFVRNIGLRPNFRIVVETQPRSGTIYTIKNLRRRLDLRYASTFPILPESTPIWTEQGGLYFEKPNSKESDFIVFSHFFRKVPQSWVNVDTGFVRLISYPFDSYYSWVHQGHGKPDGKYHTWHFDEKSEHWQNIRKFISHNVEWILENKNDIVRYEDLYFSFEGTKRRICREVGLDPETPFSSFDPRMNRMYFEGQFSRFMSQPVFEEIGEKFEKVLQTFYPERRHEYHK